MPDNQPVRRFRLVEEGGAIRTWRRPEKRTCQIEETSIMGKCRDCRVPEKVANSGAASGEARKFREKARALVPV
jgi:hypothetical protein